MLYGAKQAAFLFYDRLQTFFTELGFTCSDLDQCFFKRHEADGSLTLLIIHVDDFRLGGTKKILDELYTLLFKTWKVTTCSGKRFLGIDVEYRQAEGWLKFSMTTYIAETIARFQEADTSAGFPYRELVGCLHKRTRNSDDANKRPGQTLQFFWSCRVRGGTPSAISPGP